MSRIYPSAPLIGVGVVVFNEKKQVVLIKRGNEPKKGLWAIPGGTLKLGEKVSEAAIREIREECDINIELRDLLGVVDLILKDSAGKVQYHYVLIDYLGYGDNSEIAADALAAAVGRGQVFISIASIMELWLPLREGDATGPGEKGSKRMIGKNQIRKEVRDILRLCERLGIKIIYCTPRAQEKALDILKVPRYRSYLGQSTNAIIDSLIIRIPCINYGEL